MTGGRDRVVSVRLPGRDVALLRARASERGETVSQAARRALVAFLSGETHLWLQAAPLQATHCGGGSLVVIVARCAPTASTTGAPCRWRLNGEVPA